MKFEEVGKVRNEFDEPRGLEEMRQGESVIEVYPNYEAGLYGIENSKYIQVLFGFHLSEGYELVAPRRGGDERGVFASRSPHRPSSVGTTVVELLERDGNELRVEGLDAVNGSPVIDIKPYAEPFDSSPPADEERKRDPRKRVWELIDRGEVENLLIKAGEIHGHFCPFLSLGVMAGQYAVSRLGNSGSGMEEIVAIVETNSCFSDGIQYVTGCTFGNNGLIYRDYGKTAVTVALRDGHGIRLYLSNHDLIMEEYPEARELFEKVVKEREGTVEEEKQLKETWRGIGFDLVKRSPKNLFDIEEVESPDIPDYAPIYEDGHCNNCGEKFMAPKGEETDEGSLCRSCASEGYLQLDGSGLREIEG